MTAIVAGQGQGLINTSLGLLGEQGQLGVASQGRSGEKVVVNAANGNLVIQQQDEWLVGVGPDVGILRTYNSQIGASGDGDNGDNWRLGLSRKVYGLSGGNGLNTVGSTIIRVGEDGSELSYGYDARLGAYVNKDGGGSFDTLKWDGPNAAWVWTDGNTQLSEAYAVTDTNTKDARLKQITDLDLKTVVLDYTGNQVTKITTSNGEYVVIAYDATGKNILSLTTYDKTGVAMLKRVSYSYDNNRLNRVTVDLSPENRDTSDRAVYITEYTYVDSTSKRISTLKQGTLDGTNAFVVNSTLAFEYETSGSYRITKVKEDVGGSTRETGFAYTSGVTKITDPLQQVTELTFDIGTYSAANPVAGQLKSIKMPSAGGVDQLTTFNYDATTGNVTSIVDARGNTTIYRYDDNGNRIYERDAQGNVIQRSYSSKNLLLSETAYTSAYVDGSTPTLAQGALTSRYIYDAQGHLRFAISPQGRVTEHQYNAQGQRIATLQYSGAAYSDPGLPTWSQNFDADTTDITLATGITRISTGTGTGALQVTTKQTASGSSATYPKAYTIDKPLGMTWRAEVTVPSTSYSGKNLLHIGLESGTSGASSFRNNLLLISGGNLYFKTQVGSGTPVLKLLGAATPGKTYVLEIDTQAEGKDSQIYVYESGKERTSGYTTELALDSTSTQAKLVMIGYTSSDPDTATAAIQIDNLSATPRPGITELTSWAAGNISTNVTIKSSAQRTDYTYDLRGQLDTQTTYAKTGSDGAGMADGSQSKVQLVYDQAGNLLQKIDARGIELTTQDTTWAKQERVRLGKSQLVSGLTNPADIAALKARYTTVYTYDGLNRIVSQLAPQVDGTLTSVTTVTTYNDTDRTTTVKKTAVQAGNTITLADNLTQVNKYDQSGRLLSVTNSNTAGGLGTTTYTYDVLGRLVMVKTPGSLGNSDGDKTFYLYDAQNRKIGEINAEGALTEYAYNQNNQVVRTIRHASVVSAANLATLEAGMVAGTVSLSSIVPSGSSSDRYTFNAYDKAGRLVASLASCDNSLSSGGEALAVTMYVYDGASRLLSQTAYQFPITKASDIAGIKTALSGLSVTGSTLYYGTTAATIIKAADRQTRYYYNADGQRIGELDAENYYSAYSYDEAGRLKSTTRYAAAITTVPSGNTPPTPQPPNSIGLVGEDQTTRYFYNAKGQLVGTVDPQNYYTTCEYDTDGNRTKETRYSIAVSASFDPATGTPLTGTQDRSTTYTYDGNNRLTKIESSPSGEVVVNEYDGMGNLVSTSKTIKAINRSDQTRVQKRRYDSLGRLTAELTSEGSQVLAALATNAPQSDIDNVWNTYATRYVYDDAGRMTAMIQPNGVDASGNTTVYYYDKVGHLTHSINALGEIQEYGYTALGDRTTERVYGARATNVASLKGGSSLSLPDAVKSLASASAGSLKLLAYGRAGLLRYTTELSETGYTDFRTYNYDALGNLLQEESSTAAGTLVRSYWTDKRGLRTQTDEYRSDGSTQVLQRTTKAEYDAFGRQVASIDGRGIRTERYYDKRGRVLIDFAHGTSNLSRSYLYDAFDRVITMFDEADQYTIYKYDDVNRQLKITTPQATVTLRTLDSAGQTVAFKDANGNTAQYTYDTDGRLLTTKLYDKDGATLVSDTATSYDKAGRVYETRDARGAITRLSYDQASRVLTRTVDANGLKLKTSYRYDAKGQAVWVQDPNGVWTQTEFDIQGRVRNITVDPKQIPASTNTETTTGELLALTANTAASGGLALVTHFEYDEDGRTLLVTKGYGSSTPVTTSYTYDVMGRRTSETLDPSGATPLTTQYAYDANDNLVTKTDAKGQVTRYTYDRGNRLVYTVDATGAVTRNEYDILGHVSRVTAYATRVSLTSLSTAPTSAEVAALVATAANASKDHVTCYVYDADGRLTHTIDALGGVSARQYDANGNVTVQTRYFTPVTMGTGTVSEDRLTFAPPHHHRGTRQRPGHAPRL